MSYFIDRYKNLVDKFRNKKLNLSTAEYKQRLEEEKAVYKDCENVSDLPAIFRYWADTHLIPAFREFGFATPEHFFFKEIVRYANISGAKTIRMISIGAGNCDVETYIAQHLIHENIHNLR